MPLSARFRLSSTALAITGTALIVAAACPTVAIAAAFTAEPARPGSAIGGFGHDVELHLPGRTLDQPGQTVLGLACTGRGNCVAGASYTDRHGHQQAALLSENNGRWDPITPVRLPADAGRNPYAQIRSIARPRAGHCVAIGNYLTSLEGQRAFIVMQTRHGWDRARQPVPPPNVASGPGTDLTAITCAAPGLCEAVGNYTDRAQEDVAMAVREVRGHWQPATELQMPSNADPNPQAQLLGVTCPRPGDCTAVGNYQRGEQNAAVTVDEVNGRWKQGAQIRLPGNAASDQNLPPYSSLSAISCPRADSCIAVGSYQVGNAYLAMTVQESRGSWGRAQQSAAAPRSALFVDLNSIACRAVTSCVVVGDAFYPSRFVALALARTGRGWTRIGAGMLPVNANSPEVASLTALSCPGSSFCQAIGFYLDKSLRYEAMAVSGS